jgi:hypothetical protein
MDHKQFIRGGTALSEKDIRSGEILVEHDALNCRYAWDTGAAIGRYLRELKQGRIIAKACNSCNRIMLPPRMFCELCFRPSDNWVYVRDTGLVKTFSICRINWDASRIQPGEEPYLPAVIELDGASPGMGILHMLGEVEPEQAGIGMRVRAQWKPEVERSGSITDIKYFKPC